MSRIGELVLEIVNFQGSGEEYEQYVRGVLPELVNDHLAIESIDTEENGICILHLVRHWAMTKPAVFAVGAHLCVPTVLIRIIPFVSCWKMTGLHTPAVEAITELIGNISDTIVYGTFMEDTLLLIEGEAILFSLKVADLVTVITRHGKAGNTGTGSIDIKCYTQFIAMIDNVANPLEIPSRPTTPPRRRPVSTSLYLPVPTGKVCLDHLLGTITIIAKEIPRMGQFASLTTAKLIPVLCRVLFIGRNDLIYRTLMAINDSLLHVPRILLSPHLECTFQTLLSLLVVERKASFVRSMKVEEALSKALLSLFQCMSSEDRQSLVPSLLSVVPSVFESFQCPELQRSICDLIATHWVLCPVNFHGELLTTVLSRAHSPGLLPEIIRCFESAVAFSRNSTQEQGGKLKKRLTYTPSASIRDDETDPVLISSVSALATLCQQKLDVTAYTEYWKLCRKVHVLVLVCLRRGSPSTVVKSASLLQEVLDRFQAAGKEHPSCNAELFPVVCEMCRDVTIVLERRDTLLPADSCDETGKVIWQYISRPCIEVVMGHGGEWSASHYCIWTQAAYALSSDMVNSGTRWSYTHQLLMSNDEDQVVASVNMLPLAVASSLQSQTIPSYFGPRDCLKQLLERLCVIQSRDTSRVRVAIAKMCGQLACVGSGKCIIERQPDCTEERIRIKCHCSEESWTPQWVRESLAPLDRFSLWKALIDVLQTDAESYATFIEHSLPLILLHLGKTELFRAEELIVDFVALVQSEEEILRNAVPKAIATLGRGHLRPVFCQGSESRVFHFLRAALESNISDHNLAAIQCFGALGSVLQGAVLHKIIAVLLKCMTHENQAICGDAFNALLNVARSKGHRDIVGLLDKHRADMTLQFVAFLANTPEVVDQVVAPLYTEQDRNFLTEMHPSLLPALVATRSERVLKIMAECAGAETPKKLIERGDNLLQCFLYLLLHTESTELDSGIRYLTDLFEVDVLKLFIALEWDLVIELFKLLGSEDKVLRWKATKAYTAVCSAIRDHPFDRLADISSAEVAHYLNTRFMWLSYKIQQLLTNEKDGRTRVVRGFMQLLVLVKDEVHELYHHVLEILKAILHFPELHVLGCAAWRSFVKMLPRESLGQVGGEVVIYLLPFLSNPDARDDINQTLRLVLVNNHDVVAKHIQYLPQLPPEVDIDVRQHVRKHFKYSFAERIRHTVAATQHDNVDVRLAALKQLYGCLETHEDEVCRLIRSEDFANPLITSVLQCLLHTAKCDRDPRVLLECARCFGELGAVDPGRIKKEPLSSAAHCGQQKEEAPVEIARSLLRGPVLQLLKCGNQRLSGFAGVSVQELVKFCANSEEYSDLNSIEKRKQAVLEEFDEELQVLFKPYLRSVFRVKYSVGVPQEHPIFPIAVRDHRGAQATAVWLCWWTMQLGNFATETLHLLTECCRPVLEVFDSHTAMALLPSLLKDAVLFGTDEMKSSICEEIESVLKGPLNTDSPGVLATRHASDAVLGSLNAVFQLIDTLSGYLEDPITDPRSVKMKSSSRKRRREEQKLSELFNFLEGIRKDSLAFGALRCKDYPRAIYYFELHSRKVLHNASDSERYQLLRSYMEFHRDCYEGIDEPDGLSGLLSRHFAPTSAEQLAEHKNCGRWMEAISCYERSLRHDVASKENLIGLLECYMRLGHFETVCHLAANFTGGVSVANYGMAAAWRLSRWSEVERFERTLPSSRRFDFESSLGSALMFLKRRDKGRFTECIRSCRLSLMSSMAASRIDSYKRVYDIVTKLHLIHEVDRSWRLNEVESQDLDIHRKQFGAVWDRRMQVTQQRLRIREPMFHLHRVLGNLFGGSEGDDNTQWVHLAKCARKEKELEVARSAMLHTTDPENPMVVFQQAKLQWLLGDTRQAVDALCREESKFRGTKAATRDLYRKVVLCLGGWYEISGERNTEQMINHYESLAKVHKKNEDVLFALAKYYDTLLMSEQGRPNNERTVGPRADLVLVDYLRNAVSSYTKALSAGMKNVYHSMPRVLTLWFSASHIIPHDHPRRRSTIAEMDKIILQLENQIPTYVWLVCISHLVSRICHPRKPVQQVVHRVLAAGLQSYFQQTWWSIVSSTKSNSAERRKHAEKILDMARKSGKAGLRAQMKAARDFCDDILTLGECDVKGQRKLYLTDVVPRLADLENLNLIIPLQRALDIQRIPLVAEADPEYSPYPEDCETIACVSDEVDVMASLQRPKRIHITSSTGVSHSLLVKPKDDLRKDQRLMEFNSMINRLLLRDPEGRRRALNIRTYAAIPIDEESGIIEWVPRVNTLRAYIVQLYALFGKKGIGLDVNMQKTWESEPKETKVELLRRLNKQWFPVLHRWFLRNFRSCEKWLEARLAFTRTSAVMSMVGSAVGLGDRHCDNIMLDEGTGEVMHCDLNCIFWKGLTFAAPECVPFRMTQNLEEALGVTKCEGMFRRICEITLRVLRDNRDALMSVLETLVHDPLVEWVKTAKKTHEKRGADQKEHLVRTAMNILLKVEKILKGEMQHSVLPLSVEGQVDHLITEARDPTNLTKVRRESRKISLRHSLRPR